VLGENSRAFGYLGEMRPGSIAFVRTYGGVAVLSIATACGRSASNDRTGEQPGAGGDPSAVVFPSERPWLSGSRLRARVLDGGDGAVAFLGWYDTDLQTACSFRKQSDGHWRCVPDESGPVVYADANCTTPLTFFVSELGAPVVGAFRYVRVHKPGGCELVDNAVIDVYETLGPLAQPAGVFVPGGEGRCQAIDAPVAKWLALAPLAPEKLVEASLTFDPGDSELATTTLSGADGSLARMGFWVRSTRSQCFIPHDFVSTAWLPTDDADRCLLADLAYGDGCSTFVPAACATNTRAWNIAPAECANQTTIEIAPITTDASAPGALCFGPAEPSVDFPSVPVVMRGGGRLQVLLRSDAAGRATLQESPFTETTMLYPPLGDHGVFFSDSANSGARCAPQRFSDDRGASASVLRCAPIDAAGTNEDATFFADAACTVPLFNTGPPCGGAEPPRYVLVATGSSTPLFIGAYRVGPAHQGTFYGPRDGCFEQPPGSIPGLFDLEPLDLPLLRELTE